MATEGEVDEDVNSEIFLTNKTDFKQLLIDCLTGMYLKYDLTNGC